MQEFEVHRRDGSYQPGEIDTAFRRFGLVVLKAYLAPHTRHDIRDILTDQLETCRTRDGVLKLPQYPAADFLLGDILSIRKLSKYDYVFFSRELLEIARGILRSPELVYYGDSSTQFDAAARGFHKDNVERKDAKTADWEGDYGIIRCAFYCEDHSRHSGGLKVRLSSHNLEATRSRSSPDLISHNAGRAVDVRSEYGDLVIWTMRLTHSGNFRKLRFLPQVCLHPRIEMLLPDALALKEEMRRYFMSCAFARPGVHLDHYVANMTRRDADYRPYLERARNAPEAEAFLATRNVILRQPADYYGRLDTPA